VKRRKNSKDICCYTNLIILCALQNADYQDVQGSNLFCTGVKCGLLTLREGYKLQELDTEHSEKSMLT
jgi:hypothetical protein